MAVSISLAQLCGTIRSPEYGVYEGSSSFLPSINEILRDAIFYVRERRTNKRDDKSNYRQKRTFRYSDII